MKLNAGLNVKLGQLKEILDLHHELTFNSDIAAIRGFLIAFDYNENQKDEDKISLSTYACDNIQDLLKKCLFCIGDLIPKIEE